MSTTVNDFFAEYEKGGFADTVLVDPGTYTVELKAKSRKKGESGGIFVEGTITEGPEAGKYVNVFSVWYASDKGGGDIATKNLAAIGIDRASLVNLAASLQVQPDSPRFTEALAPAIDGRVVVVELEHNEFKGTTTNRMAIGKATYKGGGTAVGAGTAAAIPQVAAAPAPAPVAAAPAAPAPVAAVPAPAPVAAAPPPAPVAAAPPPVAAAPTPAPAPAAPAPAPEAAVAVAAAPAAVEPF